ncbi:response regulator FixJ [Sphingomonas oligophenolica]|uniref:Response regulator n=1 Tax=Sphingomonas oligophenolica TaxID=301154 RepID=A0ABU9Y0D5_9SPHN
MVRTTYIVDDDNDLRKALSDLLELQPGQSVRSFDSGEALLAEASNLDPGVLLLDLNMPGLSGLEVLKILQAAHPHKFEILILTGMGTVPRVLDAMRSGASDFIQKPCPSQKLFDAVDAAHAALAQSRATTTAAGLARAKIASLSPRERDVLMNLLEGRANKMIAAILEISARTVEIYRSKMMAKLDVRSLPAALRIAFAAGLTPDSLPGAPAGSRDGPPETWRLARGQVLGGGGAPATIQ